MKKAVALSFVIGLIAAPQAIAADRFVDEGGSDAANDCANSNNPCATINHAQSVGSGDRILLGAGTYVETVTLAAGEIARISSVFAGGSGAAIIDNSVAGVGVAANPAVTLSAGTLRGITLRSDQRPLRINGGTAIGNTFDQDEVPASSALAGAGTMDRPRIEVPNGAPLIQDNVFTNANNDNTLIESAILIGPASPQVIGNEMSSLGRGISMQGANTGGVPLIQENTITGLTDSAAAEDRAIFVRGMGPTIVGNEISAPAVANSIGVDFNDQAPNTTGATAATFKRNRIIGMGTGVRAVDTNQASGDITISLNSDLIAKSTVEAVRLQDNVAPVPPTIMTATLNNVTLYDGTGTAEIALDNAAAVINSSIVGAAGVSVANTTACEATFSRGPVANDDGCDFATQADPIFVDAAGDDYHLQGTSPLIDAGDPAPPAEPNALDLDTDPRAVDATPHCSGDVVIRDIGADEFEPATIDCLAPNTAVAGKRKFRTRRRRGRVAFSFSTNENGAVFQCKLDKSAFAACTSPFVRRVRRGRHKFQVRSIDPSGNVDATPAVIRFRVNRVRRR